MTDKITQRALQKTGISHPILFISITGKVRKNIKKQISRLADLINLSAWKELHYAPVRGPKKTLSEDLICLKKTFKEIDAEIEIEKQKEDKINILIKIVRERKSGLA